ncbi:hypothetical protein A3844_07780 [Paenibacillus helianthi]|uniref:Glycosyl transferase family 1 domain-containing protein n=1 Tax=Paenibacillus helianthi TaxID=1349432 RepID=A0ABX3ETZ3_9BACL|nr:glycosyltransferase [Paenibacillus helianthi]OKP88583.1 hypothetical protein A3844_07780 [Paenibacillus helianthi]
MRVLIAVETHFYKTPDGTIWTEAQNDKEFWGRYLEVFKEVHVLARVANVSEYNIKWKRANGDNVLFHQLPNYTGPYEYIQKLSKIKREIKIAILNCDVAILRVAGAISTLAWRELKRKSIPFGVEVCGDPWESLKPGTVKSFTRPLARLMSTVNLKKQCKEAITSSYVTKETLQKRYPPKKGTYTCGISDVNLPEEAYLKKIPSTSNISLRILNVGSMETLYKAQNIQLMAIKVCVEKGLDVHLQLIGEGRCRPQFESLAKELGVEDYVDFLGMISGAEEVRKYLDSADLFIMPSMVEGLPRALVEAMARSVPCIATNVGGIPELLPLENLIKPNDYMELASKIETLINDKEKLKIMGETNYFKAMEFNSSSLSEQRRGFYGNLFNKAMMDRRK